MRWHRAEAGLYLAQFGAARFKVGLLGTGEWFAEGPGVDQVYRSKGDAQQACEWAVRREG